MKSKTWKQRNSIQIQSAIKLHFLINSQSNDKDEKRNVLIYENFKHQLDYKKSQCSWQWPGNDISSWL